LAAFGLAVTSNNAAALVSFLEDFEAENSATLPSTIITDRQGWLNIEGRELFLCGDTLIGVAADDNQSADRAPVTFRATDEGNRQIADAIRQKGTFDAWQSAIQQLDRFPRVLIGLFTSLAAPLLKILQVASFVVDFSGETSTGKTTTLRVAASVWGNPCESGLDAPSLLFSGTRHPRFSNACAKRCKTFR
jgi:hypothetical protein